MKSILPWFRDNKKDTELTPVDMFERYWDDSWSFTLPSFNELAYAEPASLDVSENEKEITVRTEIPGLSEKDMDVSFSDGYLTIKGEKKEEKEEKKKEKVYRECQYGNFFRKVPIGENVLVDKAFAKYKKGVLTITIPKKEIEKTIIKIN
ncbi:MAG: Hsp20/alpha crystallin family protein [Fibrobacteria bacterium]|nr:Hsp20/alpha crystallin family protein [Fibrobacteria bacterium]